MQRQKVTVALKATYEMAYTFFQDCENDVEPCMQDEVLIFLVQLTRRSP